MKNLALLLLAAPFLAAQSPTITSPSTLPNGRVGTPYSYQFTASPPNPDYSWQKVPGDTLPPGLNLGSSGLLSGTPTTVGDFSFRVALLGTGADSPPVKTFNLTVDPPVPHITTTSLPNGTVGQAYSKQMAATSGTPPYDWSATGLPPGLSISPGGAITGTPTTAGGFNPNITVSDANFQSDAQSFSLSITQAAPRITTTSLPSGTVGLAYSKQMAATSGTPPYDWSATGLPPGLSISPGGAITGTPTTAGDFNPNITVRDADVQSDTKSLSLSIAEAPPKITTTSLPSGTVGLAYDKQVTATGGVPPYEWSATGLPPGLAISPAGAISGTPSAPGTFTVMITVHDSVNGSDSKSLSIDIQSGGLSITTLRLPDGTVGEPYNAVVRAANGSEPYKFSFGAGVSPPGLMISADGIISGMPTAAGSYSFDIRVIDAGDHQATKAFSVSVIEKLRFKTPVQLPAVTAGQNYQTMIAAAGGTPPYVYTFYAPAPNTFNLTQAGLLTGKPVSTGTLTLSIQVADQVAATARLEFKLDVSAIPSPFQPSSLRLDFDALMGGDPPPAQSFSVVPEDGQSRPFIVVTQTASPAAQAYAASGSGPRGAAPTWLTVTRGDGVVPARFNVAVDQAGLAAGQYQASMEIRAPDNAAQAPVVIPIGLTVTAQDPVLDVPVTPVRFQAQLQNPGLQDSFLTLRNAGGGGAVPFTAQVLGASPWIVSVTPANGQTARGGTLIRIQVDTTGLVAGQYRDVIRFSAAGGFIDVPVTVFVAMPGPQLALSVRGVRFRTRQGNGIAVDRSIEVINRGTPGTTVHWVAELAQGGQDWLDIPVAAGTAIPGTPSTLTLRLKSNASTLAAGSYYALLRVYDQAALNSPQYATVVLEVAPNAAVASVDFPTAGVVLTSPPGSAEPQQFTFMVAASTATPISLQAAAATIDGDGWLSVSPASTQIFSTVNAKITVTATAAALAAGIYRGQVVLNRDGAVVSLNITFIVADAVASDARSLSKNTAAATCIPRQMAITPTGMPNNFAVPAGWPATVIVQLRDNCGRPVRNADLTASFSSGDPPVYLADDDTGNYSATWQPAAAGAQVNIKFRATAPGLDPSEALLIGNVSPNMVPTLAPNGTLHNLNPKIGGALAPGVVAQVYGTGLAAEASSTNDVPLVSEFRGTIAYAGPYQAPLYYVSPGQLVIQLPAELASNQQYSVAVASGSAITIPDSIDVVAVQPGVAAFLDGRLIAQHSDYSLVTDQNPAKRGEYLIMYLAGLGATDPPVPSGTRAPGGPLAVAKVPPTLTIGGETAPIVFAGLTPGGVGLFQINFQVPSGVPTGTPLDVVVKQGDVAANVTKLTVVE